MNWVDYLLLALVALSAVQGMRLGAAMQLLSYGAFWIGLFVGALLAPPLAGLAHGAARALIALVVLFGVASMFGAVGRIAGARSSVALRRLHLRPLDSALGVMVAVVATLVATWLVASVLVGSRFTALDAALEQSRIVRAENAVLPPVPSVFSRVESFLASTGFPVVFTGLPPVASGPVALPSDAAARAAVRAAAGSVVKVEGIACGVIQEGSGFVARTGLVVTNAHVVAGEAQTEVLDTSGSHPATVVLFDPDLDIAVLRVPGLSDPALPVDDSVAARGVTGVVLGYPGGGPLQSAEAGVAAPFEATGLDIYGRTATHRQVYELYAVVRPGNSGGPLVASGDDGTDRPPGERIGNGAVIGVVFARSTTNPDIGYALAMPAVLADVARVPANAAAVGTGGCAS